MANLTHLNVYTDYSLLESTIQTEKLIEKCKQAGHDAVAITNQGNMFNMLEAINMGLKEDIKVIPGLEVGVQFPGEEETQSRVVLLGMNLTGYQNLMKLSSKAMTSGEGVFPKVGLGDLREQSEGVICLSGGVKSPILCHALVKDPEDHEAATEIINRFKDIYGNRYYLQLPYQSAQGYRKAVVRMNEHLVQLGASTDTPIVATGGCRYIERQDYDSYVSVIKMHIGMNKAGRGICDSYWFQSEEDFQEILPQEAIDQTKVIADRCEQIKIEREFKFPETGALDAAQALKHDVMKGLKFRFKDDKIPREEHQKYIDRANFELETLENMGFSAYILVVADFVQWAKANDIPVGPGRGSAAGSIICWATNITDVDSLKYDLLFERFINPERITMPDIDMDFDNDYQGTVKQYLADKYGEDKVASIGTFGTMAAKGAVRDIGKAEGFTPKERNDMASKIPEAKRGKNAYLKDAITDKKFQEFIGQRFEGPGGIELAPYEYLYNLAAKVEGQIRNTSTHAAGVVISDDKPLTDYLPLHKDDDGHIVTQYGMDLVEKIGLIKFDILALKTLAMIRRAVEAIEKNRGTKVNIKKIAEGDPETYDLLCRGDLTGIFQLGGSSGFRELTMNIQPRNLEEITDITSIYRPGPLDNKFDKIYIANKHSGKYEPQIVVPGKEQILDEILRPTKGVIIYQEQVMRLAQELAGFTLAQADLLRRAMGKKDEEKMAAEKAGFVKGCIDNGVEKAKAEEVFDILAKFAEYGFNKSHAIAYSMITYQTAWLKAHYPIEFLTSCLTQDIGDDDSTREILGNCRAAGINLLIPDINKSEVGFTSEPEGIRFGFGSVKGLGTVTEEIITAREKNGEFRSLYDFCGKVNLRKVNKKSMELLIKAGAFDNIL